MNWHGYKQVEGADPERPWWHKLGGVMERTDGGVLMYEPDGVWFAPGNGAQHVHLLPCKYPDAPPYREMLARIDREYPLPAPEARCGQVWISSDRSAALLCTDVIDGTAHFGDRLAEAWPPPGAILVAGPGSPWAPPEKA